MSEQPVYKSKYNPPKGKGKPIDYNKDKVVNQWDDMLAVQDYDGDGNVSERERTRFRKERDELNTEYKYNAKGELVETKVTGSGKDIPEPAMSFSQYTEEFLKTHPAVRKAIQLAIENGWTQDVFNEYIESQTAWGRSTTAAQALFDLQITGSDSESYLNPETGKIPVMQRDIQQMLVAAGVTVPEEEVAAFARTAVRSGLDQNAIRTWIAGKFSMGRPTGVTGATGPTAPTAPAAPMTGGAANIGEYLRTMARQYGLPITDRFLESKIREGLGQGDNWREWAEGQRGIFRAQAKTLYPTSSDLLDEYTLDEVLTPYLNAATNLLGIPREQMRLDNPMWNAALNGENGPMSLDQWVVKLKTDSKYGYDKTNAARQDYTELVDGLLSTFGMA